MAHLGWILPVVGVAGGYLGGILTGIIGHVGKYSLDQATKLKELIVQISRAISDFENPKSFAQLSRPHFFGTSVTLPISDRSLSSFGCMA